MKNIVESLIKSVGAIANVGLVIGVIWTMFAILAVNLWSGSLHYCTVNMFETRTEDQCLAIRGTWTEYDWNWNDYGHAMMMLFNLAT